jgi:hypothetical protein
MPKCFIIMPITTRPELLPVYENDVDHFKHVLEHLLVPTINAAGFEPVPPVAEGSDVIHASIISNLTTADMVLCDMSALNPNVFFELGIRTALNKPTCMIKDDATAHVPFDTSIVNYHTYAAKLMAWNAKTESDKLLSHIQKTVSSEQPGNALWRYFGLSHAAHISEPKPGEDSRIEYLTLKIDQLSRQMDAIQQPRRVVSDLPSPIDDAGDTIRQLAAEGMTKAELTAATGYPWMMFERWLNDGIKPNPALAEKVAKKALSAFLSKRAGRVTKSK